MQRLRLIKEINKDNILLDIIEKVNIKRESNLKVKLYQGMPKGTKMELILQKLTEIGVDEIVLVQTKRSVTKIDNKKEDKKIERELKIKQAEEIKRQKIERAKNIEEFWNNIKIGKAYKGTVSKIVDYGIFVDLGVVTGLAHKSELVWDKNEKIEDKFQVGDEIEVKIKDFNKEERRISLEYPLKGENPWFALTNKYKINDIVTCKVVKFASFGAFVEIEKGLEGLVHNSEITGLRRVVKPEDELKIGQTVNAKIII